MSTLDLFRPYTYTEVSNQYSYIYTKLNTFYFVNLVTIDSATTGLIDVDSTVLNFTDERKIYHVGLRRGS